MLMHSGPRKIRGAIRDHGALEPHLLSLSRRVALRFAIVRERREVLRFTGRHDSSFVPETLSELTVCLSRG